MAFRATDISALTKDLHGPNVLRPSSSWSVIPAR